MESNSSNVFVLIRINYLFVVKYNIKILLYHCVITSQKLRFLYTTVNRNRNLNIWIPHDDNDGDAEWCIVSRSRNNIFRVRSLWETHILSNVISSMHDPPRQSNWFRLKGAADIFLRIALHGCTVHVSIVRREVNRAIISIRGITDVSSFHTVSTSRKLARPTSCWLAVGPEETSQNLPSGNNRCTGAIQSLPASFGSVH